MNSSDDKTQIFTTVLAYTLPLLQFFFSQLTNTVQGIFLFKSYFVVVSVFTAIVSYVMITVLRAKPWFEVSLLQFMRKKHIREWQTHTNSSLYTIDEIKLYQESHKIPPPLRTIKPDNIIQVVFLPILLIGFIVFIGLGFMYGSEQGFVIKNSSDVTKVLIQSMAYTSFIVFSVLSFAHQYIRDEGAKEYNKKISNKYEKAIQLARKRDVFKEIKKVSLITQKSAIIGDPNALIGFIVSVDDKPYVLVTDSEVDTIILSKEFDSLAQAESYVWGENQQQENQESQV